MRGGAGAPRLGEKGALGWAEVLKRKEQSAASSNAQEEDNSEADYIQKQGDSLGKNKLWLELELYRERRTWLPWRSSEEEAELVELRPSESVTAKATTVDPRICEVPRLHSSPRDWMRFRRRKTQFQ